VKVNAFGEAEALWGYTIEGCHPCVQWGCSSTLW